MLRHVFSAAAAVAMTCVAVSAVAETPAKATFNAKLGQYCLQTPAPTGTRVAVTECHSNAEWAKLGITFSEAPKQVAMR